MYAYELCRKYQEALNRKDLDAIFELFTLDACIKAPMLGELDVRTFHSRIIDSCGYAVTRLTNVFDGLHHARSIALQFQYTWPFPGGRSVSLEGVSVFEIDDAQKKFKRLTVIYDPTEVRRHMKERVTAVPFFRGKRRPAPALYA